MSYGIPDEVPCLRCGNPLHVSYMGHISPCSKCAEARRNQATHDCYSNDIAGDRALCPDAAKDRNGDIVLGVCRRCGAGEIELEQKPCPGPKKSTSPSGDFSIGGELWPGLSKLIEEAAEVAELLPEAMLSKTLGRLQRVAGKLIGSEGRVDHWSGDMRRALVEEIGDLMAATAFFLEKNDIPLADVRRRREEKLRTFRQWHREGLEKRRG